MTRMKEERKNIVSSGNAKMLVHIYLRETIYILEVTTWMKRKEEKQGRNFVRNFRCTKICD